MNKHADTTSLFSSLPDTIRYAAKVVGEQGMTDTAHDLLAAAAELTRLTAENERLQERLKLADEIIGPVTSFPHSARCPSTGRYDLPCKCNVSERNAKLTTYRASHQPQEQKEETK